MNPSLRRNDLVYPELSYRILGVLFHVWTKIGPGHKESFYQKAVEEELKFAKLSFKPQLPAKIIYRGKRVGIYYFDFLIENKVVLEIKVRNYFARQDMEQLYRYLKAAKLNLGILAHFTSSGVKYKRILNVKK